MTHYQLQLARIAKYPDRHRILIKTPQVLDVRGGRGDCLLPRV